MDTTEANVVAFPNGHTPQQVVEPKQDSGRVGAHRYTLTFQPDAHEARRWLWRVYFTIEVQYHGYASSLTRARRVAIERIRALMEEHGAR